MRERKREREREEGDMRTVTRYLLANDLFLDYVMEPWFASLCNRARGPWPATINGKTKQQSEVKKHMGKLSS